MSLWMASSSSVVVASRGGAAARASLLAVRRAAETGRSPTTTTAAAAAAGWFASAGGSSSSRGGTGGGSSRVRAGAFAGCGYVVPRRPRGTAAAAAARSAPLAAVAATPPPPLPWSFGRRTLTSGQLFMAATDDSDSDSEEEGADSKKTVESEWDVPGLKKETARLTLRCHKKIGKAASRLKAAEAQAEELLSDPDATVEQLEKCPDVETMRTELDELRARLRGLNELEESVGSLKGKKGKGRAVLPEETAALAIRLEVDDAPPKRQPRGPKKAKGPKNIPPRLPYRRYYAEDGTEIRVGKQAPDNDELSLNPAHRDGDDWWMHASGCPGSHVVVRCGGGGGDAAEKAMQDAAALAARQSKCAGGTIKVSVVRCRQVTKPRGAKAGLVQLNGNVRTIAVNMKEAEKRLDRLDGTMVLN